MTPTILDITLNILKFAGIALSGALGVIGILASNRDAEGKITKLARWGIGVVIVSSLIAVGALVSEWYKYRQDAKASADKLFEEVERGNHILSNIDRTLNPLRDIRVEFSLTVPFDNPEIARYKKRLDESVKLLLSRRGRSITEFDKDPDKSVYVGAGTGGEDGGIMELAITPESSLFPNQNTERLAYRVFKEEFVSLHFYKTPIDVQQFPGNGKGFKPGAFDEIFKRENLGMLFGWNKETNSKIEIRYDIETGEIRIHGNRFFTDPLRWQNDGTIISITDLLASQMFINVDHWVSYEELQQRIPPQRIRPEVEYIILTVGAGRQFQFVKENLEQYIDTSGKRTYFYTFPDKMEELIRATNVFPRKV